MASQTLQIMDLTSLRAVIADLRSLIVPSRFERAQQPEPGAIQIGLRTLQGMRWLELSWYADAPRLVQIPPPSKIGSESTLAQQIQHGLSQMALIEIEQKGFERVVKFGLAKRPGGPIQKVLIIELMGRHSNLLLLDNQNKVITLGRQIREHQSRVRPIGTGDFYVAPPAAKGIEPNSNESFHSWKERVSLVPISLKKALQESYQGISPSLALQLAHDEDADLAKKLLELPVLEVSEKQWHHLYSRWCIWLKKLENESLKLCFNGPTPFRVWNIDKSKLTTQTNTSISLDLGKYYRKNLDSKKLNQLIKEVQLKLMKLKRNEAANLLEQKKLLTKTEESKIIQDKANKLFSLPSPNKELIDKAQKLYLKAKKLRRSSPIIEKRVFHHKQRLENIDESISFLEELSTNQWEEDKDKIERVSELKQELSEYQISTSNKSSNRSVKQEKKVPQPLTLTTPSGLELQVGRNHRQNEWISLRKSRKGDLWFHVQECPGSHVVLKASNGIATEADIQMAADLAAFFSRAKGNQQVPILMVLTDHLQRISGATPGTVRHRNSKICWGDPSKGIKHIKA